MPVSNSSLIFNSVPTAFPIPGKTLKLTSTTIDLENVTLPQGSVLVKTLSLSLDPYLRVRMRDVNIPSYAPEFDLGKPIANFGVSVVLRSSSSSTPVGTHLYGSHDFSEYQIFSQEAISSLKVLKNEENLPWTTWVGAAGMPGQTAWYGLEKISKPVAGETMFVSGAAGAVGQMVAALCQRAGVKVIGSAGTDEKVAFLKDVLKFDVAFNYKTQSTDEILKANPFDMYWDNVGGATLDSALLHINRGGRLVSCGAISDYNGANSKIEHYAQVFKKELKFEGFIIIAHDVEEFYKTVPKWIANGEIIVKEHVYKGLDNGEAFQDLMEGRNFGKAVISFE